MSKKSRRIYAQLSALRTILDNQTVMLGYIEDQYTMGTANRAFVGKQINHTDEAIRRINKECAIYNTSKRRD